MVIQSMGLNRVPGAFVEHPQSYALFLVHNFAQTNFRDMKFLMISIYVLLSIMAFYGKNFKLPINNYSLKPPSLELQVQLDKVMSTLMISQPDEPNTLIIDEFIQQNKLQKLTIQEVNRLYKQHVKRQNKRLMIHLSIKQHGDKTRVKNQRQTSKVVQQNQTLQGSSNKMSNFPKYRKKSKRGTSSSSSIKLNRQFSGCEIEKEKINVQNSSKLQYFGSEIIRSIHKRDITNKSPERLVVHSSKQNSSKTKVSKLRHSTSKLSSHYEYNDNSKFKFNQPPYQLMKKYMEAVIKMDDLHTKQMSQTTTQLDQKQIKRLKKIHNIQKQKLKYKIYTTAKYFSKKPKQFQRNSKLSSIKVK